MDPYTLGLDIGSKSIGWALISTGKKPSIIDIGVRVFPEGVDRDTKGLEKSKNAARREARGARRNRYRRKRRRDCLINTLKSAKLLPENNLELKELFNKDPYQLRAKAINDKIDLHELGRAIFHINQRRGFKSNRKTGKQTEEGQIAKSAGELQEQIESENCRTLGEYFNKINPEEKRIRGHYTFRSMFENELDMLWKKQSEFYPPDVLNKDFLKKIKDEIIFYQRPLKPIDELIGDCELERDEKRCHRGDWYARRFRLLQDVNNLKICNPDGSMQGLSDNQRRLLLDELIARKEVTFAAIRKKLGLLETQEFNAEYEVNDKGKKNEKLKGDAFSAAMRSRNIFGPKIWDAMNDEEKRQVNEWLIELEDDQLRDKLRNTYKLKEDQIENVLKISLPRGYMSFSRKAIKRLLPLMEEGKRTDEALDMVYPDRNKDIDIEEFDKLPLPTDLRNPIVNRAMFEVRKVVNSILREYGKPDKIKIEMARDVRGSARERRQLHFRMLDNEKRNEETRKRLREMGISSPKRDDIIKYNLWEECGHVCPYTGKHISQTALFGESPEFQIEHILPYERSLDDSFMNKALCHAYENIYVKKNRTPYEAYAHDQDKFEELKQRVKRTAMPYWKKQKFWQKEIDTDRIIERELNDTRYICREVVKYLRHICKDVSGTRGKATSELGYQWGLIKDRDDHRHHALDAAVICVTKQRHLRELGKSKYSKEGTAFAPPWPHFREELLEKIEQINVSHRARRKVSGQLHEETSYGLASQEKKEGQDIFVYRKKLEDLTIAMVQKIIDPEVRNLIKNRLLEKGIDLSKSGKPTKDVWVEPLYMKTTKSCKKIPMKKVRISSALSNPEPIRDRSGNVYRYVKPGSNHHAEIWDYIHGDRKGEREAEIISVFEAIRRSRHGKPVVNRNHGKETKFVCSLAINDMVIMPNQNGASDLYRVQKMNVNKQIYFRHHTASTIDKESTLIRKQANLFGGRKVTVDPLGRIQRAND